MSDAEKYMAAFKQHLTAYKQAIDKDIEAYSTHVRKATAQQFGEYPALVTDAYLDMLSRGGKRMRGALVMAGYQMCGGKDQQMIVRAATALEMLHAYMLVIDDIQDRSVLRRNKPTVHQALAEYHRKHHLRGSAEHTGVALALNAALSGAHAAQMLLAGLSVPDELKLKVIGIVNMTMVTTAHGQTLDIMNELVDEPDERQIENALEWKTAHYSILNPLCVGMVLAGAGCDDTDVVRDYSLHAGKAFQISDDVLGVFGTDEETGKSTMDDIREGKRTLLTSYALKHASESDCDILKQSLGNEALTKEAFEQCRRIVRDSGALDNALSEAKKHVELALESLKPYESRWTPEGVAFLRGLALRFTT